MYLEDIECMEKKPGLLMDSILVHTKMAHVCVVKAMNRERERERVCV
jgi:hypothetical protein